MSPGASYKHDKSGYIHGYAKTEADLNLLEILIIISFCFQSKSINIDAVSVLCEQARRIGCKVIFYSSDYVFDGRQQGNSLYTSFKMLINVQKLYL